MLMNLSRTVTKMANFVALALTFSDVRGITMPCQVNVRLRLGGEGAGLLGLAIPFSWFVPQFGRVELKNEFYAANP